MVVRVSYCRWYVSIESPHGMFLVCYIVVPTGYTPGLEACLSSRITTQYPCRSDHQIRFFNEPFAVSP